MTPGIEKAIVESGIVLIKYWLEVSEEEQTRRLEARIHDPRKIWKLSPMDLKSYSRWYDYSRARDEMFKAHRFFLGALACGALRRQAARTAQRHFPSPDANGVQRVAARQPDLPKRRRPEGYVEPNYPFKFVPELDW